MSKRDKIINQETRLVSVEDICEHPRNPNRGDVARIVESIRANGFYGAILVQRSTGYIIKGNHTYRAAREAGLTEVPVIFVDVDDQHAMKILVADNRIAEFGERDEAILVQILNEVQSLQGTGYTERELEDLLKNLASEEEAKKCELYVRTVDPPHYEPQSDTPPPIEHLVDEAKTNELLARIDAAGLPDDVRRFLRLAAMRHLVFDYQEIAEYYAHAPADVQGLFEESALVIIDCDAAIERGFAQLTQALAHAYDLDNEERDDGE